MLRRLLSLSRDVKSLSSATPDIRLDYGRYRASFPLSQNVRRASCLIFLAILSLLKTSIQSSIAEDGQGDNTANNEKIEKMLQDEIRLATTMEQRHFIELCLEQSRAIASQDTKRLAACRDSLLQFANSHPENSHGARAFIVAGDIEQVYLGDSSSARKHYSRAAEIFERHTLWEETKTYGPYVLLRTGDSLFEAQEYESAAEHWKESFRKYPKEVFSLQIPGKVVNAQSAYLSPDVAWRESLAFYDECIRLAGDSPGKDRLRVERIYVLVDAANDCLIPADVLIEELDRLLESAKPGESVFIDRARSMLEHIRNEFQTKYPTRAKTMREIGQGALADAERQTLSALDLPKKKGKVKEPPLSVPTNSVRVESVPIEDVGARQSSLKWTVVLFLCVVVGVVGGVVYGWIHSVGRRRK